MKKTLIVLALMTSAVVSHAANFASVDVEAVKDDRTGVKSTAQYVRFGKDIGGLNLGLQARTATFDGGGMVNSVETTLGKNMGGINVFGGIGHDNGWNGGRSFQYGVVGAVTGMPVGPFWAVGGVKTRVTWDNNPKQTVVFTSLSYPVAKGISVNLNASKSYQDIRETAYGAGVRFTF